MLIGRPSTTAAAIEAAPGRTIDAMNSGGRAAVKSAPSTIP